MKLTHDDRDQVSVFSISGNLTADHVDGFREEAESCIRQSVRDFVIDVTAMPFIDSKGLEVLLWLQDRCADQLGQVRLAGTGQDVETILVATRLASRFDRHESVDAALKSLRI